MRPSTTEYAPFYHTYVARVHGETPLKALENATKQLQALTNAIPDRLADYRYGPDKWTVKELLQHMLDTERVMSFRALWIARGAGEDLPGFEEDAWAKTAEVKQRSLADLFEEFDAVRKSTLALYRNFSEADLSKQGIASGHAVSVRALAYIIAGHQEHHNEILKTRYLV